jgi:hypothetical protein
MKLLRSKAKWVVLGLLIANEIRGVIVVATVGWPILKAMHG